MKRIAAIVAPVTSFALVLTLVACAGNANKAEQTGTASQQSSQQENVTSVSINTEGMGQVAYAYEGEEIEFDDDYPFQSAVVNDADGQTMTIGAKASDGWKFVSWTKDGKDFSTDEVTEITVDGDAAYVAVFEAK